MRKYFITNTVLEVCCATSTYEEAQSKVRKYLQDSPGSVFFICAIIAKCYVPIGVTFEEVTEGESK